MQTAPMLTGYSVNDEATSDGPIDGNLNIKVH